MANTGLEVYNATAALFKASERLAYPPRSPARFTEKIVGVLSDKQVRQFSRCRKRQRLARRFLARYGGRVVMTPAMRRAGERKTWLAGVVEWFRKKREAK
jgi:hypothetical protein